MKIVFATKNEGKVKEINGNACLNGYRITVPESF